MNIYTSEAEYLKTEVQRLSALVRAQQITIDKLEAQPDQYAKGYADAMNWKVQNHLEHLPVAQKLSEWKLVPRDPTDEMLKAMDECSTEGYDERLYAGHAASVYMAAVDVAPTPPQRKEPEPVAWCVINDGEVIDEPTLYRDKAEETLAGQMEGCGSEIAPLYTNPPQRLPLTHEQRFDLLTKFEFHKNKWEAPAILIDMVEAAHNIKE